MANNIRQMAASTAAQTRPRSTAQLLATTGQTSMAALSRRQRVRWLGHAARMPNDAMAKQLLFAHSLLGHPRPTGRPHLTWMDTAP